MKKRIIGVLAIVLSMAALAPPASAIPYHVRIDGDTDDVTNGICARVNVTIFGSPIGTGPDPICLT